MSETNPPLALQSTRVVTPEGVRPAAVLMRGPRIGGLVGPGEVPADVPVRDVGDDVIMAGLVDCHVHINEPGRTEWEGFETATRAAAAGGITSVVDMPLNCTPVTTSVANLHEKLDATAGKLWVDVGFWGGVVPGNAEQMGPMARAGVLGCKAFLVHSGIDDFPDVGPGDLRPAMVALAEAGLPLLAHAELDLGPDPGPDEPSRYAGYLASRPARWEEAAIDLMIDLCRETGCPVHIVHLSAASALGALGKARAEGLPITVETCPHYLCLDAEQVPDGDTTFKCAPPIRGRANQEALWEGLEAGIIDFVISDHSPCTPHLKCLDAGDFHAAWGGIASLQLGLSTVWTRARARGRDLTDMARWMSAAPARFAGLDGRKGALRAGLDADLVIWRPEARFQVVAEDLHFRHRISPYLGQEVFGQVQSTWLRGEEIYARGTFSDSPSGIHLLGRPAAQPHRA